MRVKIDYWKINTAEQQRAVEILHHAYNYCALNGNFHASELIYDKFKQVYKECNNGQN